MLISHPERLFKDVTVKKDCQINQNMTIITSSNEVTDMETRICIHNTYQIQIGREWIGLVMCRNCHTIMGVHDRFDMASEANKIKCCADLDIDWGYCNIQDECKEAIEKFIRKV